jgi:hypothetical protein
VIDRRRSGDPLEEPPPRRAEEIVRALNDELTRLQSLAVDAQWHRRCALMALRVEVSGVLARLLAVAPDAPLDAGFLDAALAMLGRARREA